MNKYLYTILALVLSISVYAQPTKDNTTGIVTTEEQQLIEPHEFYKGQKSSLRFNSFEPKTGIKLSEPILLEANGLKAQAIDGSIAVKISGRSTFEGRSGNTKLDKGNDFLMAAAPIMRIEDTSNEFQLMEIQEDEVGMSHLKYQQYYQDVKIYGAQVVLYGKEHIEHLVGRYNPTTEIDVTPSISIDQALSTAKNAVEAKVISFGDPLNILPIPDPVTELVIYQGALAYHTQLYADALHRYEVFVDAHSGEVIQKYTSGCKLHNHDIKESEHNCSATKAQPSKKITSNISSTVDPSGDQIALAQDLFGITREIHTYEQQGTSYMMDVSRQEMFNTNSSLPDKPEGVIWTINAFNSSPENNNFQYDHVKSSNNTWQSVPEAVSSQYNGSLAYEYFLERHARISINGQKGNIISFVNVSDKFGNSMGNAFWNGYAMFYGNGGSGFRPLARGLDVAGHEMTHGVVQNTANLEYFGESGALNESFADVFGAMIDREDWLIGEDVVLTSSFPSGALRSLQDPNQGQPTNSFNTGWQPKHMNQKFNGPEDNNGVHINSGIPNHAFFRFASAVGKEKAERVYFRALEKYLVKSSKFIDARIAVIQAAQDLNLSASEIQAARNAWDAVGVLDGNGSTNQTDIEVNPGENLVMYTNEASQNVSIMRTDGTVLAENISQAGVRSRFSITDDGSAAVFVNSENKMHVILMDWTASQPSFQTGTLNIPNNENIRQVAVSRKGERLAYTTNPANNKIFVFNFEDNQTHQYELYNPTFSQGGDRTYDVDFADALEFDYSGNNIMYDARNTINGLSGTLQYYDIGVINIWNADSNTPTTGNISKLFNGLPEGVSIGNPTFSKNSEYVIAFDYAKFNNSTNSFEDFSILGANLESGNVNQIKSNNTFGFPSYATSDGAIVYTKLFSGNNPNNEFYDVAGVNLMQDKISASGNEVILKERGRRAAWFSNGSRDLSDVVEIEGLDASFELTPNPVNDQATLKIMGEYRGDMKYQITDISGKVYEVSSLMRIQGDTEQSIQLEQLPTGSYIFTIYLEDKTASLKFIKL